MAGIRETREVLETKNHRNIRDMWNPGFVFNLGLPEERSWLHACACFPTCEPTLGPNPIQPGAQTNKSVAEGVAVRNDVVSTMSEEIPLTWALGRLGGRLDPQQLASKNKFQTMQPTINSKSCFPSTSLQCRDADGALTTRTFARSHKSSANLMVSAPGHADFGPQNDLQVGETRTSH